MQKTFLANISHYLKNRIHRLIGQLFVLFYNLKCSIDYEY
jgi:signal transduction histidine kinase